MSMHQDKRLDEDSNETALPFAVWHALLAAHVRAQRRHAAVWRSALRWATLHGLGLTTEQVRSLVAAGYLWHRRPPGRNGRRPPPSRRAEDFLTHDDTLVALTATGGVLARQQVEAHAAVHTIKPVWKEQDNCLYWNGQVVRELRHDGAEVREVLRQFQKHDWCRCVETPFPKCEPTTHRGAWKSIRPPPHHPPEWLREPTAAAWLGVG